MQRKCVVVGASHAGAQVAANLRQRAWDGEIHLIGEEPWLPYHRPPLSKTFLAQSQSPNDILIRPQASYAKADIATELSSRVTRIDTENRQVYLEDGSALNFDALVLATGARARALPIPGSELDGVHRLRNAEDVLAIRRRVASGRDAVIVGGGYIGLETAASLRQAGMNVTILEAQSRVLQRVTSAEISAFYQRVHREEGVRILPDARITEIQGKGSVQAVCLDGQAPLPADLVIVGVGVTPETSLAEAAGLDVDDGIVVNEFGETSAPGIYAVGDCTRHYNPIYKRWLRLECIQNATDQAKTVAAALTGNPSPYSALPWFWSDQYDMKLQIAGLSQGADNIVLRGEVARGRSFSAFYFKGSRLLACDAVNRPIDFSVSKKIIVQGLPVSADAVADESLDLRSLVAAV